jgi:DNA-binding transcriptional regulator GbsR (MarR family)
LSEIDSVRAAFVQLWGAMGTFWGIPPTTARVYAWLLSRSEGADSEEIMAGLEMSRGAVSMACRELREWHLIDVERTAGSRRIHFLPATDLEKVIRNIVQIRKRREWDPILEHLREWIPRLEAEKSPEAAIFRQRLAAVESLVAKADAMVEMFLKGGLLGKVGLKMLVGASASSRFRSETTGSVATGSDVGWAEAGLTPAEDRR